MLTQTVPFTVKASYSFYHNDPVNLFLNDLQIFRVKSNFVGYGITVYKPRSEKLLYILNYCITDYLYYLII